MFNRFWFAKIVVNKLLKFSIKLWDWNVERNVLFIKSRVAQIQKISFSFLLKLISYSVEFVDNDIHFFKIKFCKGIELLDVCKNLDKLLKSFDKLIKSVKNLCLTEIKSFSFWHVCYFLLCSFISFFILPVELNTASQNFNNFSWISFPNILNFSSWRNDFLFTIFNHLICNFDEQSCHFIWSIVESCNCMNHFDSIHQWRKSLNNLLRSPSVKGFNKLLQSH